MPQREHYTPEELQAFNVADKISDAEQSERQASEGPFYPEKGITKESLLKYAKECRQSAFEISH